ncbi:hypothetical protein ACIP4X_35205 [Streptomyces sp. NPDC088817]|uniref:hypothetical protein n=1 Tax=unclassified Streptomyces TaxID=2593676 RepID=UPI0038255C36
MFGSGDRDLIEQILRELRQLRECVNAQQHVIDQARQDASTTITHGFAEIRRTVGDPLADIRHELATIKNSMSEPGRQPAQPIPVQAASSQPEGKDPSKLLKAAAGISAAELQMHRDTWAFLVEHAAGDRHFHVPGAVDEDDGFVTVCVSGPSIVAAITSLDRVSRTEPDPVTRAIAGHLHQRFTETVDEIIRDPHRDGDVEHVEIVIDDRANRVDDEH